MSDEDAVHALWALAEEFLLRSELKECVICLESVVQSKSLDVYPETILKTRIRLVEIYLKYTHNIDKAKDHLDQSLLVVSDLKNESEYKLNIIFLLSRLYELRGQTANLKQTLKRGTEFITYRTWYEYFNLELAKLLWNEGNANEAFEHITNGIKSAEKYSDVPTLILFTLTQCQFHLCSNNLLKAHSDLLSADNLCERLGIDYSRNAGIPSFSLNKEQEGGRSLHMNSPVKSPAAKVAQKQNDTKKLLKIYHSVLYIIFLISTSNYKEANLRINVLNDIISSLSGDFETVFFSWVPSSFFVILTYLFSCICHRPIANIPTAIEFGNKGIKVINTLLTHEQNSYIIGTELSKCFIHYKFIILENLIYIHLSSGKLKLALEFIEQLVQLYEQHKENLPGGLSIIHTVLGLYASTLKIPDYAITHFQFALHNATYEDLKYIIEIYLSLAYLKTNQLNKAQAFVFSHSKKLYQHPNRILKAGIYLVEGLLDYHLNNLNQAKVKLKESLSITNGSLSHNQMAATALNGLGAVFLKQEPQLQQSSAILKSSLVLSHRSEDFFSKLASLELLSSEKLLKSIN
eukprot:TRINITY_DN17689_c0_g1_i2.p1 TRINITY_DN17689_c0_g1~~TRINITY_DN17689_c0_g1_i2.p1  ORF type:complete len:587 (+),score=130.92 TRINITY_DN17689_c0_g1_i2:35-1762(+)